MKLSDAVNISDVRTIARRRLPGPVFDMLDGGAGDELTVQRNEAAFRRITLRPRPMVDVAHRDTSVEIFGQRASMPVFLAPTGAGRIAHRRAELAVAGAARAAGTIYMQSTVTGFPLEEVAKAGPGALWYQLYLPPSRDETREMLDRVRAAGYRALAITVDTPVFGARERDSRNRFTIPIKVTPKMVISGACRPAWSLEFLRGNLPRRGRPGVQKSGRLSPQATQAQILATQWPVTWEDLEFVRSLWQGPLLVKGIMRADECGRLVDAGVDGIIVSNHGGRQLDGVPATVEVLPSVVEAVAGRAEVFLDGGVRRGTDVLRALAIGARAVFVGRPYIYGLAAGGEQGVIRVLELLHREFDRAMALTGCRTVGDIDPSLVNLPWTTVAGIPHATPFRQADTGLLTPPLNCPEPA